jgi:exonuclease SbcC
MFRQLNISNFQSHKNSSFEFCDGVNIIIGDSDAGKSAVIRALRWLIMNRPQGDSIRSWWGGETSVELITDNCTVTRSKGKSGDEYILGKTSFKAFNKEVPKEITDALNLSETNIQFQLDQPYLLNETPGNVALHFNKVARLDKIDLVTSNINSQIRELTTDIKYKESQKVSLTEEVKQFEWLGKFEIELEVLEELEKQKVSKANSYKKLETLWNDLLDVNDSIKEESQILLFDKPVDDILGLIEKRDKVKKDRKQLDALWIRINMNQQELEEQSKLLQFEKPVNALLSLYEIKTKVEKEQNAIERVLNGVKTKEQQIKAAEISVKRLEKEFEESFPDTCPLCNKPK